MRAVGGIVRADSAAEQEQPREVEDPADGQVRGLKRGPGLQASLAAAAHG